MARPHPPSATTDPDMPWSPPFLWRFLTPGYWLIWGFVGVLWGLAYGPHRLRRGLAVLLAGLYRRAYPKRTRIVARNLALCFPEETASVQQDWLKRHFVLQAYALLDLGRLWFRSPAYLQTCTRVSHPEVFARLVAEGGVILTGHSAGMEWVGHFITLNMPGSAMYKPFGRNQLLNWLFERGRMRHGARVYPRDQGLKPHLKHLRAGQGFFYIADEDLGATNSVFVPFFGVEKATVPLAGKIAALGHVAVFPVMGQLDMTDGSYRLLLLPPADVPVGADQSAACAINQTLETLIRDDPAQYMWSLKLFKTRPGRARELYD